jgi:hypothetical protein
LACGSAGLAEQPVNAQLTAERGERLAGPAVVAVDPGLASPDQDTWQATEPLDAAGDPGEQVLGLLAQTPTRPHRRSSSPSTRSRRTRGASGHDRPGPRPPAPTGRTG